MATGVLVNNSHTTHRSASVSQTTSSTKLNTSSMQPQNTPNTRPALDQAVDQILAKANSPLGENDVQAVVEALGKMLEPKYPMSLRARRRCFRGLVKICGEYGVLPSSCIIPESRIQKLGDSPVSSGGFSDVWPGIYNEDDEKDEDEGKSVAIKVIRYWESDDVEAIKKSFFREIIIWKRLSHPNILELIGVIIDDEKKYSMVSPWMENGNIVEFLRENLQANPLKLLEDVARGLQYLHGMDLAHGDLKGENILVSEEGRACLADVGLTRIASDLNNSTAASTSSTSSANGPSTARWCPRERLYPEMFGFKSGNGPTKKADIYSIAMTIYEVLTDRVPFYEYNDFEAMLRIIRGERPKKPIFSITRGYTKELWDMATCCWDVDPTKRPTVDHVLDTLRIAAEQWKPKHGGLSTQDYWNSTDSEEESDPPTVLEPENEPIDDTSGPLDPPQSLVIETPIPAPAPAPPSVFPPSTVEDLTHLESTSTTKNEEIKSTPAIPPKEEPRPSAVISRKEMEPALVRPSREEGRKPIPAPSSNEDVRVAPVVPPKQEKPKLAPVTSKDEVTRPAPDMRSREEELGPTLAIPTKPPPVGQSIEEETKPTLAISKKEEIQHGPASLPEARPRRVPAASKDEIEVVVPLRPAAKEVLHKSIRPCEPGPSVGPDL